MQRVLVIHDALAYAFSSKPLPPLAQDARALDSRLTDQLTYQEGKRAYLREQMSLLGF